MKRWTPSLKSPAFSTKEGQAASAWRGVALGALLLLIGVNLRSVILAVPPILPLIRQNLGLSYTETGLLTALPTLVMGAAAWSSGLLVERTGARRAVTWGLALLAAGALLRAVFPLAIPIFLFTLLMSLGIALAQTTASVLIRRWFPARIGLLSAIFTDGLIIGETIGAGLTVPLMLWLFGPDGWRSTFVLWGLPIVVLLAFWLWLAPGAVRYSHDSSHSSERRRGGSGASNAREEGRSREDACQDDLPGPVAGIGQPYLLQHE